MTNSEINAMLNDLDNQIVTADGDTRGQLKNLFDAVCNEQDWKNPIDREIVDATNGLFVKRLSAAIEFFTGTKATFTLLREESRPHGIPARVYRVTAIGYRLGPCN